MKKPIYNPLAMASKQYADAYGRAYKKFDKIKQSKQIEKNRKNIKD